MNMMLMFINIGLYHDVRSVAGVDSLGLGSDFNGVGQYPRGLEDVSKFPSIFTALIQDKVKLILYCYK